jgi:ribosomal protein L37AE/L43A
MKDASKLAPRYGVRDSKVVVSLDVANVCQGFRCPLCHADRFVANEGSLYRCKDCGLGFSDPHMFRSLLYE